MAAQPLRFIVPAHEDGVRLDRFLHGRLAESETAPLSRTAVAAMVESGSVSVRGVVAEKVKPSLKLSSGSEVTVVIGPVAATDLPPNPQIDFELIHEDEDLAVISKPPGLATHPQMISDGSTLASGLVARFGPSLPLGGGSALRPGIVHRLDAETSGVMVIAKSEAAMTQLKAQFATSSVKKKYLALVAPAPDWDHRACAASIARDPFRPQAVRPDKEGRAAHTEFEVQEKFEGFSRVSCSPRTGRTHQIRIHLSLLGHPVVCDKLYGGKQGATKLLLSELMPTGVNPVRGDRVLLDRHALHAMRIAFVHPVSGQEMAFEAELPEDLEGVLMALRIHRRRESV